jgi:inorganic pyrophosphatase
MPDAQREPPWDRMGVLFKSHPWHGVAIGAQAPDLLTVYIEICAEHVAELCMRQTGRTGVKGDGDPLDICILTEKTIPHGDILLRARPIGGLRLLDGSEADDKIVAVLEGDIVYGSLQELDACPRSLVDRLRHYFLTYKDIPGAGTRRCELAGTYGARDAKEVIGRAAEDYKAHFGEIERLFGRLAGS